MPTAMSFKLARWTESRYVCARCWHHLIVVHHDGQDWVECSNAANCDGQGYVTKRYAERRLQDSLLDLQDAKANIGFILPEQPKRTEKQLLSSVGF
jgi:hypothetical protein